MRRFIFFISFFPSIIYGQHFLPIQHDTISYNHEIILNGMANYSGNAIRVDLAKKLFYGGSINKELIDASSLNHNEINRFGMYLNSEVEYRNKQVNLFKNPNYGFVIKGGVYSYFDVLYPKGVYDLSLYGNSSYPGQEINLSATRASAFFFQKIGFGYIDKSTNSSVSINLVNLSNYASLKISDGYLYQSDDFDTVNLNLTGTGYLLDSPVFFNGIGASIDADLRIPVVTPKEDTINFQFKLCNFGFAHIYNSTDKYDMNKELAYSGVNVNSALSGQSLFNNGFSVLDSLGIEKKESKRTVFLPGYLQMSKLINESSERSIEEFYGVRMFFSSAYNPLVFAGLNFKLGNRFNIGGCITYGGFASFSGGMYSSYNHRNISFSISTENISGVFLNNAKGESIIFRFRCAF